MELRRQRDSISPFDIMNDKLDKTVTILLITNEEFDLPFAFHLRYSTNADIDYIEFIHY